MAFSLASVGMKQTENVTGFAARAALWSARHRTVAILGWIAFVVGITIASGQIGSHEATMADQGHGESGRADRIVEQAGFPVRPYGEMVLIQGADRDKAVADVTKTLTGRAGVAAVAEPLVSPDGGSTLVPFTMSGDPETAKDRVLPLLDAVAEVQQRHPGVLVAEAGDASGDKLIGDSLDEGLTRLSMLSIPVSLGILLVAFGAVVAAVLPVGLAVTAVVAAFGLLAGGEPIRADRRRDDARDAACRPRGRRRLLPVLHPPGARRAPQRRRSASGAGHRRADVRPVDLDLRPDRHRGHVRHVLHPGRHVHQLRGRHDPGGGHRGARLADRAPRAALGAGRPGRRAQDPGPVPLGATRAGSGVRCCGSCWPGR
nr:hypothetical protein GCM10020092_102930 [Actinoplanes digitatis]